MLGNILYYGKLKNVALKNHVKDADRMCNECATYNCKELQPVSALSRLTGDMRHFHICTECVETMQYNWDLIIIDSMTKKEFQDFCDDYYTGGMLK